MRHETPLFVVGSAMQHGDSDGERTVAGAAATASGGAASSRVTSSSSSSSSASGVDAISAAAAQDTDNVDAVDGDEHAAAAPGTAESRNHNKCKADAFAAFGSMGRQTQESRRCWRVLLM
jgi:hypothetical protein